LPDRYTGFEDDIAGYPEHARAHPVADFRDIPELEAGFRGLEATRKADLEDWMEALGLDAVVFPALADVGPADADVNPASADLAWRNGVWVANGNLAIRHMGVPTVTLPMGVMADTGMPMGLTFAGRGWDDVALLDLAAAFESVATPGSLPPRTPPLPVAPVAGVTDASKARGLWVAVEAEGLRIETDAPMVWLTVDGARVPVAEGAMRAMVRRARTTHRHSEWMPPWGPLVVARFADGSAAFAEVTP
jgi:amidase